MATTESVATVALLAVTCPTAPLSVCAVNENSGRASPASHSASNSGRLPQNALLRAPYSQLGQRAVGLRFVVASPSLLAKCRATARVVGYPVPCPTRVPEGLSPTEAPPERLRVST